MSKEELEREWQQIVHLYGEPPNRNVQIEDDIRWLMKCLDVRRQRL